MTAPRTSAYIATMLLTLLGCSKQAPTPKEGPATASSEKATFVNRVWRVAESSAMSQGQLVVFLSEGTLVFASPHGKPALGTWSYDGKALTMIEEGLPYKVDILKLTKTEFRILSHNPGGMVETQFVPAEESPQAPERP